MVEAERAYPSLLPRQYWFPNTSNHLISINEAFVQTSFDVSRLPLFFEPNRHDEFRFCDDDI